MGCGGSKSADVTFDTIEGGQPPASGKAAGKAATPASTKKAKERAALELKAADHELHKCEGALSLEELEHQDTIAELQKAQDAMQARRPPMRPARRPLHR